jgi:hypothetical protein
MNHFSAFGGDFPSLQDPSPPAGQGHQQRSPAVFAGGIHLQGIAAVTGQGIPDSARMDFVQGFQIPEKKSGQIAYFPAREMNTVVMAEVVADFVALAMIDETLDSGGHHSVISDRPSWNEMLDDGARSVGNQGSGGVMAFDLTNVYGLADLEGTVSQGPPAVHEGFLYAHGSPAQGTRSWILASHNNDA